MDKTLKYILLIALFGILVFTGFVVAGMVKQYLYPSTAQGQIVKLTIYFENTEWANNTAIPWGKVESDTSYYDYLNIKNTGQLNCTVIMSTLGLPVGWAQTWDKNGTELEPDEWANGTITLTTTTVEAITYELDTIIKATQTRLCIY